MARVLVTGGAGFIGSHIVDSLLADGNEVSVLDDLSSGSVDNLPAQAKFFEMDVRSREAAELVRKLEPQVLVHAAAQISVRASVENPYFDADVNLMGLLNLLNSARRDGLPYLVFISTGGALYGDLDVYPAPETHRIRPDSAYGLSKYCSELYLDFWHRQFGLSYAALRLSNVYGPRQNPHGEAGVVAIFSEKLLRDEVPTVNGSGEQTRDFVFVTDVVEAVRKVIKLRKQGAYNIGTGTEISINKLFECLLEANSLKVKAKYGPAKIGEPLRSVIDPALAKQALDWSARTDIKTGLKVTFEWFKSKLE